MVRGLEGSFLKSWTGLDEVGDPGDLCFYNVTLRDELQHIVPEGTEEIMMTILMSDSKVQFEFFKNDNDESLGFRVFEVSMILVREVIANE